MLRLYPTKQEGGKIMTKGKNKKKVAKKKPQKTMQEKKQAKRKKKNQITEKINNY
jgi:hypothetical protein